MNTKITLILLYCSITAEYTKPFKDVFEYSWYSFFFPSYLIYLWHWKCYSRASLVVQWLRICLPMQGTWVWALAWEDLTCHGATKPMRHNCWACALELASHNYWAHEPQLLKPMHLEPVLRNKRSHDNERAVHSNKDPTQPKIINK